MFCTARTSDIVSCGHARLRDIGSIRTPNVERTPNEMNRIRQPTEMITALARPAEEFDVADILVSLYRPVGVTDPSAFQKHCGGA
ncbi:hypothetical protein RvVAR031_pl04090 (plasmid) [Agrobacterium vitis]|nr:hypothetical protein RvVAR031_pl04090 [Agrobacterium vitis]